MGKKMEAVVVRERESEVGREELVPDGGEDGREGNVETQSRMGDGVRTHHHLPLQR